MPPIATGREATLNDMIAWPSAIAIIGTQDSRISAWALAGAAATAVMAFLSGSTVARALRFLIVRLCLGCPWSGQGSGPPSIRRFRDEQVQSQPLGQELGDELPLTLLPAASSGGANVPSPPLPGETVTMPPPIPLLPGSPMSYSQSPEVSYSPAVAITASA